MTEKSNEKSPQSVPEYTVFLTEDERFTLQWLLQMFTRHWGGFSDPQLSNQVRCLKRKLKFLEAQQDAATRAKTLAENAEVQSLERMLGTDDQEAQS